MYREMLRKKWEQEEEEAAKKGPGPVHYQNVKFDGKKPCSVIGCLYYEGLLSI